ncbi:hypothetical protein LCGC14_2347270 [marine sediment metagenome]|uniref:Uncharacterized protein n=1 Tax=marine sediment metagenome TaxID=412755 RepID=A0A0F9EMY3_9ZZZZ
MTILQLHWQFKDGTTEMRAQRGLNSLTELKAFVTEVKKDHPLPEGAVWMCCNEDSKHFVMTIGI